MRATLIGLSTLGLGALPAVTTSSALSAIASTAVVAGVAASPGCGGCGEDVAPSTLSPAQACLEITAYRGWGCAAGSDWFAGTNTCAEQLVIAREGTTLATDLVVPPGESFSVDVDDARGPDYALTLGATALTFSVEWDTE